MNHKWQNHFRRMLAMLLCVASVLGLFPAFSVPVKAASIIATDGYITRDQGAANAKTTDVPRTYYDEWKSAEPLAPGSAIIIRNKATGYILAFEPATGKFASTNSLVQDNDGGGRGYYMVEDSASNRIYMDQGLRSQVLWVIGQMTSKTAETLSGTNLSGVAADTAGATGYKWPFGGREYLGIHLQKGYNGTSTSMTSMINRTFWNNSNASDMARHIIVRYDSEPFSHTTQFNTAISDNNTIYKQYRLTIRKDDRDGQVLYYFANNDNDYRILNCTTGGTWKVKRYQGYADLGALARAANTSDNIHQIFVYQEAKDANNNVVYKNVAFSGYSEYYVGSGYTKQQVIDTILSNIAVFDPNYKDLRVAYDSTGTKEGYYYLDTSSLKVNTNGDYVVGLYYNGASKNTLIQNITVSVMDLSGGTYGSIAKEGVITRTDDTPMPVYAVERTDEGEIIAATNPTTGKGVVPTFTFTKNGVTTTVNITRTMIQHYNSTTKQYEMVDTTVPGTYSGLHLLYYGTAIATDFTLHVAEYTLAPDQLKYPLPGSVGVNKQPVGTLDFSNSGKGTIQLSAMAESSTRGVDLIIVMDLSNSMKYKLGSNSFAAETTADPSRLTVMKTALNNMITKMQTDGMDIRIAMADFGDLDHYEFEDAVLDKNHRAWPQIEMIDGKVGEKYADVATASKFFAVNYNTEIANQLNFILGKGDKTAATTLGISGAESNNSQPFYLHPYKYDSNMSSGFTGKLLPKIYTGSTKVNADAFVHVNDLTSGVMSNITSQIDTQCGNMLGTNYDVGLEYAYRLAYARQQANLAHGENRVVSCVFMSDGAAMQYNYFSGRSQSESWSQYLVGNTDEIVASDNRDRVYSHNLVHDQTLHPAIRWVMQRLNKMMVEKHLWVAKHESGENPNGGTGSNSIGYEGNGSTYTYEGKDVYNWGSGVLASCCGGLHTTSNFRTTFLAHNANSITGKPSVTNLDWYDLLEIIYDNRKNPALYAAPNPFGTNSDGDFNYHLLIQFLREPAYKNDHDFVAGSSNTWQVDSNGNVTSGTNTLYNERYNYQTYSPYWYFYNMEGKNWWAEAMKGDASQVYPVINRNAGETTAEWQGDVYMGEVSNRYDGSNAPTYMRGQNYISGFTGLGIDIYTIGFAITADDNMISRQEATQVLRSIASSEKMFYDATNASQLTAALEDIMKNANSSATNAYYIDTMGAYYHLDTSKTTSGVPAIKIMSYTLNDSGARVGNPTVLENVTFGNAGVAYSSLIGDGATDIYGDDGLIVGSYFVYNTNTTEATMSNGMTIPGESFYWNLAYLPDGVEMVLEYTIYRDNDELANQTTIYPTNKSAVLHYEDYLGNHAHKETVSPQASGYTNAQTTYQFYLVNDSGTPIKANGTTTDFKNAAKIGNTVTAYVAQNGSMTGKVSGTTATWTMSGTDAMTNAGVDTKVFELYNSASYTVTSVTTGQSHTLSKSGSAINYTSSTSSNMNNSALVANVVYLAVKMKTDNGATSPDTVVIDYGLPATINMVANDTLSGKTLYGYKKTTTVPNASTSAPSGFTTSGNTLALTYGSITGTTYTPGNMQMNGYEKFVYCVKGTVNGITCYQFNTVTVIPATTIYYEDTFVQYNQGTLSQTNVLSWASWSTASTSGNTVGTTQGSDATRDKIYGYDSAYSSTKTYSGTAQKVTVDASKVARVHFTFTGTGFDVISYTGTKSGSITAYIYQGAVNPAEAFDDPSTSVEVFDKNGNLTGYDWTKIEGIDPYKSLMVNTYYSEGNLYQVPIIKQDGLPYGTYTVEILVAYDEWFAEPGHNSGQFDFYLDSIRIYNPAGIQTGSGDTTISGQHSADGEAWPRFQELRNLMLSSSVNITYKNVPARDENGNIISGKTVQRVDKFTDKSGAGTAVPGILFMDGKNAGSFSDYVKWGPNNEIYLRKGQTIAFKLNIKSYESSANASVNKVDISIRSLDGTTSTVTINSKSVSVSATEMYYNIADFANSSSADQTVTITAGSNAMISIGNVKLTHKSKPSDYTLGGSVSKRASAEETSGELNTNAASMASLIMVDVDMANQLLDEIDRNMAAPAELTAKYASLSFKDLIHCNIYFDADRFSGINTDDLGLAVFATNDIDGTVDTASYVVSGATLVDGMYKVSTQGIPAKNLGDTIYFKVFAKEADGSYTYSDLKAYSPVEYANFLISSGSDMDKTLAAAMLNYGAEAQKYFGYNTENLMNADVTEEANALLNAYSINDLDALDAIDDAKAGAFTANGGFSDMYPSVSFKGAFRINYYFQPSEAVDGDMTFYYWTEATANAVTELTADNADGVKVMTADNGIYADTVDGIFAKDLDKTVYVAAVYQANGETYCTGILPYSVAEYARAFANTADDFAPFATATGIYGSVAKAYFGN